MSKTHLEETIDNNNLLELRQMLENSMEKMTNAVLEHAVSTVFQRNAVSAFLELSAIVIKLLKDRELQLRLEDLRKEDSKEEKLITFSPEQVEDAIKSLKDDGMLS